MHTLADFQAEMAYERETGLFWYEYSASGRQRGRPVGHTTRDGYVIIRLDGKCYMAHRVAWLFCYGVWPVDQVDHINGVRNDNRIENLREATAQQQALNTSRPLNAKNLVRGIRKNANKYEVRMLFNGKRRGASVDTLQEAVELRAAWFDEKCKRFYHD